MYDAGVHNIRYSRRLTAHWSDFLSIDVPQPRRQSRPTTKTTRGSGFLVALMQPLQLLKKNLPCKLARSAFSSRLGDSRAWVASSSCRQDSETRSEYPGASGKGRQQANPRTFFFLQPDAAPLTIAESSKPSWLRQAFGRTKSSSTPATGNLSRRVPCALVALRSWAVAPR